MDVELDEAALRAHQHRLLVDFDVLDMPADAELDAVTRVAAAVAGVACATVNLLDTERQCQPSTSGFTGADSPRSDSMCALAIRTAGVVLVPDASLDPRFATNPWVDGRRAAVRLYASAPLVVDGIPIGSLCIFDDVPGVLSADQLARLADLARVVTALLERRRADRLGEAARAELVRANDELVQAQAFTHALLDALPVGVIAMDGDRRISLFNEVSRQWHGGDVDRDASPEDIVRLHDLYDVDGVTPLAPGRLPLARILREGRVAGAEMTIRPAGEAARVVSCSGGQIQDAGGRFLGAVVTMADVTAQRALEEQLRTAALHDPLTGLPNRTLLVDRLEHTLLASVRGGAALSLLYCDLDGFKAVNDRCGHTVGDEVLVQAAARLLGAVRPGDTVARIGGDEFVLLCPGVDTLDGARAIADRVTRAMAEPIATTLDVHRLGISVGFVTSGPGSSPETLLTCADEAMYQVKRGRRGPSRRG